MTTITEIAEKFYEACETGKGWEGCRQYAMEFDGDRIRHMTKIWNAGITLKQFGWA